MPGETFRRYVWPGPLFGELSDTATASGALTMRRKPHTSVEIDIGSLEGAVRAEIAVEYWGGHVGTSEQSFSINGGPWSALPQPEGTPGPPECYMRTVLGNPAVEIPLDSLRIGTNEVRFHAGPQICHDFQWGFFWIYAFTIRVYFEESPANARPTLSVDGTGEDSVRLAVALPPGRPGRAVSDVRSVDVIARYSGYDWKGNGRAIDWQYHLRYGDLLGSVARWSQNSAPSDRSDGEPLRLTCDLADVPDQQEPIEALAMIEWTDGSFCVSDPVRFDMPRSKRSLVLIAADKVPDAFGVRMGQGKTCLFRGVRDHGLVSARVLISTWSGAHADEVGLNGRMLCERIGVVHDVSHDVIPVPPGLLNPGTNTFYVFSRTEHHAAEVNWPGPGLLLEYRVE
jgi:hypothetical protein